MRFRNLKALIRVTAIFRDFCLPLKIWPFRCVIGTTTHLSEGLKTKVCLMSTHPQLPLELEGAPVRSLKAQATSQQPLPNEALENNRRSSVGTLKLNGNWS